MRCLSFALSTGLVLVGTGCSSSGSDTGAGGATTGPQATVGNGGAGGAGGASGGSSTGTGGASTGSGGAAANTAFLILMENHNWNSIKGSASAPYINGTLLTAGAHAEQYMNPPLIHPSEPNYIWLEAGSNFGIADDGLPAANHQATTDHLVTYLEQAGLSWKSYQEDISGTDCPLVNVNDYAPKHNPMVFFDDVTDNLDASSQHCKDHVRPYTELADDLTSGAVANYNFLTPNLCNDMHDSCAPLNDRIKQGDTWLSNEIPKLQASDAYKAGAIIFITWDEGELSDGPIGMIVLSNSAKVGYASSTPYTHSSTLRTMQELFNVHPMLRDAAKATDLSELFTTFP